MQGSWRDRPRDLRGGALLLCAALAIVPAGCGQSVDARVRSARTRAGAVQRELVFGSSSLTSKGEIPARYECKPGVWLPFRWGRLPAGTRELVLYAGALGPPKAVSAGRTYALIIARSLVVGLKPSWHELTPGKLPGRAHALAEASMPSCPSRDREREYVFRLYAMPRARQLDRGSPLPRSPSEWLSRESGRALAVGVFTARYAPS